MIQPEVCHPPLQAGLLLVKVWQRAGRGRSQARLSELESPPFSFLLGGRGTLEVRLTIGDPVVVLLVHDRRCSNAVWRRGPAQARASGWYSSSG